MADDFDDDLDAASILVPVDLLGTDGAVVSITSGGVSLAEDTNPAWDSTVTYSTIGQRVHSPVTHRVYENLKDDTSNVGKDPTLLVNQTTAAGVGTYWQDVAPTNRAAMSDGQTSTQTVAASPLVITIDPGAFNGFALFGIDADTMTVQAVDTPGGNVIYSESGTILEGSMPADYYEYFFGRFRPLTKLVRTDIEPYADSRITITLAKGAGTVKLGMLAIGDLRPIGIPQRDARVEPMDFSINKYDAFGNATLRKRGSATGMTISTVAEITEVNSLVDTIQEVLSIPVVVVGSQAQFYEWMTVFGTVSASVTPVPYPDATLNITVKGLL